MNRSQDGCLNHTTTWDMILLKVAHEKTVCLLNILCWDSIYLLSTLPTCLGWPRLCYTRANQLNMFLYQRLYTESRINLIPQRFVSQELQQKHDSKGLCHAGCFLPDHKFCHITQLSEQNMFLQRCGKYPDRNSNLFHLSSYMTYINTTKKYIRVGEIHSVLAVTVN